MSRKPLPPLLEGWVRDLHDKSINIYIRENSCRELLDIRDTIDEAIKQFYYEKNRMEMATTRRKRR